MLIIPKIHFKVFFMKFVPSPLSFNVKFDSYELKIYQCQKQKKKENPHFENWSAKQIATLLLHIDSILVVCIVKKYSSVSDFIT